MKSLAREECLAEILRRLRTLGPDSVRRWGEMSAHQMVCHLSDACRVAMGQKAASDATSRFKRTAMKWVALYAPFQWPAGIQTTPEVDQKSGGTRPVDFRADVVELEALLKRLTARDATFVWASHPIFGRMSETAWLRWAYLHADHHLRQFGA